MNRLLRYTWVTVAAAVLYLGGVFSARYLGGRSAAPRLAPPRATPAEKPGTGVRIAHFYADTGEISKGERVLICYGVERAEAVRIDPPVEELKPHWNRCFAVFPQRTTTFTLTATGADGKQESASFTVIVNPPPPRILFVALSGREIRRGEPLTMCYGVKNASSSRLEPVGMNLPPLEKHCIRTYPVRTLDYTLVAASADGRTDREKFTIRVK